jgi:hypothetical protein
MLVNSDNIPQEFEFLEGGVLVRWNVQEGKDPEDGHTTYNYQEIKIELTDTKDQIVSKLTGAGYTDNVSDFADSIIAFRGN